jgi:hypothetical protein
VDSNLPPAFSRSRDPKTSKARDRFPRPRDVLLKELATDASQGKSLQFQYPRLSSTTSLLSFLRRVGSTWAYHSKPSISTTSSGRTPYPQWGFPIRRSECVFRRVHEPGRKVEHDPLVTSDWSGALSRYQHLWQSCGLSRHCAMKYCCLTALSRLCGAGTSVAPLNSLISPLREIAPPIQVLTGES